MRCFRENSYGQVYSTNITNQENHICLPYRTHTTQPSSTPISSTAEPKECSANSADFLSPMAYKPMEAIVGVIGDTVDVSERIVPVYNFKAGTE